ncbi:MAG: hypothetical protein KBD01_18625 [Acidobacteria bacterium]|nr:hypothetical protein [Acidobacteriota bacterium]
MTVTKGTRNLVVLVLALLSSLAYAGYYPEVVQGSDRMIAPTTSLEYDASGDPTIAYGDGAENQVRLETKSGGTWSFETADARYPVELDHAIDTNGNVLICYKAATNPGYTLFAAQRIGGAWSVSTVAKGVSASAVSCAYDLSHVPYVSHAYNGNLYLVKYSGGKWGSETVAQKVNPGEPSLVFDAAGKPAIAYYDNQLSGKAKLAYIKLARKPGSKWSTETAASAREFLRNPSLAFDPTTGEPMISYYVTKLSPTPGETRLATRSAGIWTTEFVANGWGTMRVDAAGNPRIGLRGSLPNNQVFVASRIGGVWTLEVVETSPNDYAYSTVSTALDSSGEVSLSYTYRTDVSAPKDLRFASWVSAP